MHILLWLTVSVLVVAAGYAVFVAVTLGLHERLALAFRGISIEAIPDRVARYYGKRILLSFPATLWDLLAAPAPETLRRLAEFTRMPETALADLTIAGTDLPQRWWSIRQITPDPFAPSMEYTYHPTVVFPY